jgi:hypothetical protein
MVAIYGETRMEGGLMPARSCITVRVLCRNFRKCGLLTTPYDETTDLAIYIVLQIIQH